MITVPALHGQHPEPPPRVWTSRYAIGFVLLAGIAAWFLLGEYRAHLAGGLPLLLLLLCPLLHRFMHRGHGDHGAPRRVDPGPDRGEPR